MYPRNPKHSQQSYGTSSMHMYGDVHISCSLQQPVKPSLHVNDVQICFGSIFSFIKYQPLILGMVINEYNENKRKTIIIDKLKSVNPQKNKISKLYDKISIQTTCDGTIYCIKITTLQHTTCCFILLYTVMQMPKIVKRQDKGYVKKTSFLSPPTNTQGIALTFSFR